MEITPSDTSSVVGTAGQSAQQLPQVVAPANLATTATSASSFADIERANEQLLGIFNLIVVAVLFLLLLASLPRAVARLHHPGAWHSGWLLKHRKTYIRRATEAIRRSLHLGPPGPQRRPTVKESLVGGAAPYASGDSDEGHGFVLSKGRHTLPVRRVHQRGPAIAPSHVPSWTTLLYPVSAPFGLPFSASGLSNAQVMLYGAYAVMFVTFAFVMTSGTGSVGRAGWLVVASLPLMVALGSKNSIVSTMVGSHYGKLNFIHRFMGRMIFVASMYHVLAYLVIWLTKGTIDDAAKHVSAWVAFGGISIVAVASLPIIRRSAYNLFYHAHWIGYSVLMFAVCFHVENAVYWTLGAMLLLGLDHICRLVKSHLVRASVTTVPDLGCTRVEIPHLTRGWRAGQHVRVRALSSKMGLSAFMEAHPFTIASVSENVGGEGVVLYIKKAGDWTKKLYSAADMADKDEKASRNEEKPSSRGRAEKGFGSGSTMRMVVEGPYGGHGHAVLSSFSAAFVILGGSGITYGLACVEEMIRDSEALQSRIRLIHLIWVVQDPASLIPLLPNLTSFLNRTAYIPSISLKVTIHYTRAASSSFTRRLEEIQTLPKHLHVRPGRPKVSELLTGFVDATNAIARGRGGMSGVAVLSCGPKGLTEDVRRAGAGIAAEARNNVGGVEFLDEAFGW